MKVTTKENANCMALRADYERWIVTILYEEFRKVLRDAIEQHSKIGARAKVVVRLNGLGSGLINLTAHEGLLLPAGVQCC